jgi:hypothetical protein
MLTTERQSTEGQKRLWREETKCKCCYICKKNFRVGDEIYVVLQGAPNARHASCARHPAKVKEVSRPSSGTGKRRRCGGHGWSGGDGFVDL